MLNAQKTNSERARKIEQAIRLEKEYEEMGMTYFATIVRSARRRIELAKTEDNIVILEKERVKRRL